MRKSFLKSVVIWTLIFSLLQMKWDSQKRAGEDLPSNVPTSSQVKNDRTAQNFMTTNKLLVWPNARVPYYLKENLDAKGRQVALQAISAIENNTCVRFIKKDSPDNDDNETILVFHASLYSNLADVGRQNGSQTIKIVRKCESFKHTVHDLLHSLGMYHEIQRPDRDRFVRIIWENIIKEAQPCFHIIENASTQSVAYNFRSIMHLPRDAFSANGLPTIMALDAEIDVSGVDKPDIRDYFHINLFYCGATSLVINDFQATPFHHHIELKWKLPVLEPLHFSVWCSCRYFRAKTPYVVHDSKHSAKTSFVKISKLNPGSECRVRLRAVYNPASIDNGLIEVLETRPARPSTPQNPMVSNISETSVMFSWAELENCEWNGHAGLYKVYVDSPRVRNPLKAIPVVVGDANRAEFKITNLDPCKEYAVRVVAVNDLSVGGVARPVLFRTPPFLTMACLGQIETEEEQADTGREFLKITVSDVKVTRESATVYWNSPIDSHGHLLDVSVLCIIGEEQVHLYLPPSHCNYTVYDLAPLTPIEFSLRAITLHGDLGPATVTQLQTLSNHRSKDNDGQYPQ